MIPLSRLLKQIEAEHGVRLYPNNLTARRGDDPSPMQMLAEEGLAALEQHGQRKFWMVAPEAAARLVELHTTSRPGRPPGEQMSLWTYDQVVRFLQAAATAAPNAEPDALRALVAQVTGLSTEEVAGVQRIVIPLLEPKREKRAK